jgi:ring-1,2-phenylacetyl-CoA epoxidase subunit PaaD
MRGPTVKAAVLPRVDDIWSLLAGLPDPEVPVVSVVDLGMIRDVSVSGETVEVSVAPTYSGCPATEVIEHSIIALLRDNGITEVRLRRVLSPPWTTDWITDEGRAKLLAYGIAPPATAAGKREIVGTKLKIACPQCKSLETTQVSEFGSTPCKASYKCRDCLEPFEYFKCI